jgi:hypothetical protein
VKKIFVGILLIVSAGCTTTGTRSSVTYGSFNSYNPIFYYDTSDTNPVSVDDSDMINSDNETHAYHQIDNQALNNPVQSDEEAVAVTQEAEINAGLE